MRLGPYCWDLLQQRQIQWFRNTKNLFTKWWIWTLCPRTRLQLFHVGGSSLLPSKLASKLQKIYNGCFSGADIFRHNRCIAVSPLVFVLIKRIVTCFGLRRKPHPEKNLPKFMTWAFNMRNGVVTKKPKKNEMLRKLAETSCARNTIIIPACPWACRSPRINPPSGRPAVRPSGPPAGRPSDHLFQF